MEDGIARFGAGALVCAVRGARDLPSAATAACSARELGRPLLLAHVVPPRRLPATAVGAPAPGVLATDSERLAGGRRMLDEIACAIAPVAPRDCATRVLAGAVAPQLTRLAAEEDAALVAVGRPRSVAGDAAAAQVTVPRPGLPVARCGARFGCYCSDPCGASSTRSARALKKSLRVMMPRTW